MIKNVLFDMGNVLIRFAPEVFVRNAGVSGDDQKLLLRELFGLGAVWGQEISFLKAHTVASIQKPMGGFLVYAVVAAIVNALFPAACAAEEEPGFAGVAAGTAEGGNE